MREINLIHAMNVFSKVREQGEREGDAHCWQGLCVRSEQDGYLITLFTREAELQIGFHNLSRITAANKSAREQLKMLIDRIDRQ